MHFPFKRAAGRHDFLEQGVNVLSVQRASVGGIQLIEHLSFPFGAHHRCIGFGFDMPNRLGQACALVQQGQHLLVNAVNLIPELQQFCIDVGCTHHASDFSNSRMNAARA